MLLMRRLAVALLVALLAAVGACASNQPVAGKATQESSTAVSSGSASSAAVLPLRSVEVPAFSTRDLVLRGAKDGGFFDWVSDSFGSRLLVGDNLGGRSIVDAMTGRVLSALPGPQKPGWFIASMDMSKSWLVWYETPEGSEGQWALYFANLADLKPRLLASAASAEVQVPLFSLVGDRVVWFENHHQGSEITSAALLCRNLASGDSWRLDAGTRGINLPQISGDHVWWIEYANPNGTDTLLCSALLENGHAGVPIALHNQDWVYYYPAVSSGAAAWIVRGSAEPDYGTLYVQLADGRRFRLEQTARKIRFIGDLLIYDAYSIEGSALKETIGAIDLVKETKWTIVSVDVGDAGDSWEMAIIRARPDETLVLQRPHRENERLAGLEVRLVTLH